MMHSTDFTTVDIVYRTCLTIVRHIRNHVEEARGGIHTRLFSHILHPEKDFIYIGTSPEAYSATEANPKFRPHPEHVVPCAVLVGEVRRLVKEGRHNDMEIGRLLQKNWMLAFITKEQADHLDYQLGFKSTMPKGWCFENGDPMARFKAGNITLK
ncbi:hypothetical protein LNV09_14495 [Paucibacter sp. B2R-40]|uniref:hypothetical protein n=1 Tax=Paucibacter sp. B2R-40 TaxID=2893554 RepID=UPI0021E3D8A2|nr:hypothetical protein [Paucibacter sp. B2R-40]MCV2355360.1 hypothetical protein [Paucibacter sp. B2R-40]